MGKGDKKSKRGKINSGSYGKTRPRKSSSAKNIPVKVLDENDKKTSKAAVRKDVGFPTEESENAEDVTKPKKATKAKAGEKKSAAKSEADSEAAKK